MMADDVVVIVGVVVVVVVLHDVVMVVVVVDDVVHVCSFRVVLSMLWWRYLLLLFGFVCVCVLSVPTGVVLQLLVHTLLHFAHHLLAATSLSNVAETMLLLGQCLKKEARLLCFTTTRTLAPLTDTQSASY